MTRKKDADEDVRTIIRNLENGVFKNSVKCLLPKKDYTDWQSSKMKWSADDGCFLLLQVPDSKPAKKKKSAEWKEIYFHLMIHGWMYIKGHSPWPELDGVACKCKTRAAREKFNQECYKKWHEQDQQQRSESAHAPTSQDVPVAYSQQTGSYVAGLTSNNAFHEGSIPDSGQAIPYTRTLPLCPDQIHTSYYADVLSYQDHSDEQIEGSDDEGDGPTVPKSHDCSKRFSTGSDISASPSTANSEVTAQDISEEVVSDIPSPSDKKTVESVPEAKTSAAPESSKNPVEISEADAYGAASSLQESIADFFRGTMRYKESDIDKAMSGVLPVQIGRFSPCNNRLHALLDVVDCLLFDGKFNLANRVKQYSLLKGSREGSKPPFLSIIPGEVDSYEVHLGANYLSLGDKTPSGFWKRFMHMIVHIYFNEKKSIRTRAVDQSVVCQSPFSDHSAHKDCFGQAEKALHRLFLKFELGPSEAIFQSDPVDSEIAYVSPLELDVAGLSDGSG